VDWQRLTSRERLFESPRTEAERTAFERDQDRIVFSAAFRRLQDKTQVHPFADTDYVRRRLTHSIEASCVGRSLGTFLGRCVAPELGDLKPEDIGQIATNACLAHDIGNPPFGHAGEKAIASYFQNLSDQILTDLNEEERNDLRQFEGNAQGFRILTVLQEFREEGGMRLTCATLSAFSKYPISSGYVTDEYVGFKKHGFFSNDREKFSRIATEAGIDSFRQGWRRHPVAYLMEAADDICYRVIDIEDAFKLGRFSYNQTKETLESMLDSTLTYSDKPSTDDEVISRLRARVIGDLIRAACGVIKDNLPSICDGTFEKSIIEAIPKAEAVKNAFNLVTKRVFLWERTLSAELAGVKMVLDVTSRLVEAIKNPKKFENERLLNLLSPHYNESLAMYKKLLLVTDFVSGMTDSHLQRIHRRLTGHSIR
jgi:dGTPase